MEIIIKETSEVERLKILFLISGILNEFNFDVRIHDKHTKVKSFDSVPMGLYIRAIKDLKIENEKLSTDNRKVINIIAQDK